MPYPHLKAKHCLKVSRKLRSEARNLPTCGCKSMTERPTNKLRVFIALIYTHTMPNIYYCSTCMMVYPHLMAKLALKLEEKWDFSWSKALKLPIWGCESMAEYPTIMVGVFINLLYTHKMPNIYFCSKSTSLRFHLMAKRCLKVAEIAIWGKKSAPMGL